MCGRYYLNKKMLSIFYSQGIKFKILKDCIKSIQDQTDCIDIRPGNIAPVIIKDSGKTEIKEMYWGFDKNGGGLIINARIESMHSKSVFAKCAKSGRCVLPVAGYYEWRKSDGQKYAITINNADAFYLAGLYRSFNDKQQFVVVTQQPCIEIAKIHHRMPVILCGKENANLWLDGKSDVFSHVSLIVNAVGNEQLKMDF